MTSNSNHDAEARPAIWQRVLPDVLAVLSFLVISFVYFAKPVTDGLVLTGHDHAAAVGAGVEMQDYRARHGGERTRWTNTLFSGMPTYQMSPSYPSTDRLTFLESIYKLYLPDYMVMMYVMLLGFYIMLRAFDFKAWMAALGAVLWAFSSYYIIIIFAGHIWKFYTLAFIPPTIGGMVLCYRGKYLWGLVVTAFFMALQILSNHPQMSYYFLPVMALMALAFMSNPSTSGKPANPFKQWLKGTAVFAVGCLIGVAINISNLYHTWEYSKESMRGKSELTSVTKDASEQTDSGLERSYITNYSYGIGETWTLLVPNIKGGGSGYLINNPYAQKVMRREYADVYNQLSQMGAMNQYWGGEEGTVGPVYVGAFVVMLFVLGLFLVRGPMKWSLFIATVLSIMLAWGRNFQPLTDFFIDYIPMYSKFRAVESILVVAEFTIPLLAMLTLKRFYDDPGLLDKRTRLFGIVEVANKWLVGISFALTGGAAMLFYILPSLAGDAFVPQEAAYLNEFVNLGYIPRAVVDSIAEMRYAIVRPDALRSLLFIVVGTGLLLCYCYRKLNRNWMLGLVAVLCLADLWAVDKRYLSDSAFQKPVQVSQQFQKTPVDEMILADTTTYYRVLNLSTDTYNDNNTSYYHKSIGGYHAAKLRRYQELITAYLSTRSSEEKEVAVIKQAVDGIDISSVTAGQMPTLDSINGDSLLPVLNMLNMRYVIAPYKQQYVLPVQNPWALGNAWFVADVKNVGTADDELAALGTINPRYTAVIDTSRFAAPQAMPAGSEESSIVLTAYEANRLDFESTSANGGLAVFSDIYYPGWTCTVDGQAVDIIRANYVLRAVMLPAGSHKVVFTFDPQSVHTTETIANAALALLALLTIVLIVFGIKRSRLQS
ncbi:MAG: YfhO family protein [Bacteroidaceae bacterium]|nr:YfhO family protein [Bacteroidaceae bacterium]